MVATLGRNVFVLDAVRTPVGRYRGALAGVRPDDLAAHVVRELMARNSYMDPGAVDDVAFGAANQSGEDNRNVGRMAALLAGLPVEVAGVTLNRLCGSSLEALLHGFRSIALGEAEVMIVGGVESMSRAPFVMGKPEQAFPRDLEIADTTLGWRLVNPAMPSQWTISLGETAEEVAQRHGVSREDQDAMALRSHKRAVAATDSGAFDREIVPVALPDGTKVVSDEGPRRDTSEERLAKLRPAFRAGGSVTAGNSSSLNDGAAALLLASESMVESLGISPIARVLGGAVAGVAPDVMGIGPLPATERLLRRLSLQAGDFAGIELNEAFASQSLAVLRGLGIDDDDGRVNACGGAIALGHPLGASGARIATTLLHRLAKQGGGLGLATMCIGVGQGISAAFEVAA